MSTVWVVLCAITSGTAPLRIPEGDLVHRGAVKRVTSLVAVCFIAPMWKNYPEFGLIPMSAGVPAEI